MNLDRLKIRLHRLSVEYTFLGGYAKNPIEQSHRGIKQRYYPTLGFAAFESAKRFCQAYDEVHQFFRPRQRMAEFVSLSDRREHFLQQVDALQEMFEAA